MNTRIQGRQVRQAAALSSAPLLPAADEDDLSSIKGDVFEMQQQKGKQAPERRGEGAAEGGRRIWRREKKSDSERWIVTASDERVREMCKGGLASVTSAPQHSPYAPLSSDLTDEGTGARGRRRREERRERKTRETWLLSRSLQVSSSSSSARVEGE